MRVMHLITHLSGGGAESQLRYLATEMAKSGHSIHVAYCEMGPIESSYPGVVLHKLRSRSSYDPLLVWQVFALMGRIKPDIVHTWLLQMDVIGGLAALLRGVPTVLREPSSAKAYSSGIKNSMRVWAASRSKAIIANSQGGAEYWATLLPKNCRHIVANGLPLKDIDAASDALPLGLTAPALPIVLYVGRLVEYKNLDAVIAALAIVLRQESVHFVICGDGPYESELKSAILKKGLNEHIAFTGHLPPSSVWSLMKNASVFVSLSRFEGCPNTVMEAMACGCTPVLSDIPAHREIADDECAVLVDAENAEDVAGNILNLLYGRRRGNARALAARQKASEWSVSRMAANYESIYGEVLHHSRCDGKAT